MIDYFQFVNFTHLFQPSYSPLGGPERLSIQCKPVGLSIELLVGISIHFSGLAALLGVTLHRAFDHWYVSLPSGGLKWVVFGDDRTHSPNLAQMYFVQCSFQK